MADIQENTVSASGDFTCFSDGRTNPEQQPNIEVVYPSSTTTGVEDLVKIGDDSADSGTCVDNSTNKEVLANGTSESHKVKAENLKTDNHVEPEVCPAGPDSDFQLNSPLAVWMKKQNISNSAIDLIYWRFQKKTGLVFGSGLVVLLSLICCSVIGVITTLGLSLLVVAFLYRIGMTIVNAVQKTSAEHPFKGMLEKKIELPEDKVQKIAVAVCKYINKKIACLQKLFLVNDVVESIKFGIILWLLSYVGAMFSLMTLAILGFVIAFTIPKLYEEKQKEIDQLFDVVKTKVAEVYGTVEAKLPEKVKQYLKTKKE